MTISGSPVATPRGDDAPFGLEVLSDRERFETNVYQGFLTGVKAFWRDQAYAATVERARSLGEAAPAEIEARMKDEPAYFLYAWLERRMQQFKYSGRWGLETLADAHQEAIDALLPAGADAEGASERVPYYVRELDVHQHPGGLWSGTANAVAHEWYQGGSSFSGVSTDVMVDHYVATVRDLMPADGRVLDVACTLGRMTLALKKAMPQAHVEGIDVCEPAIRLARAKAARAGLDVTFAQENSEALPHDDETFDVIGSHWQFHELPKRAIARTLDEMKRVARKGGAVVIFDMYHVPGGPIGQWLHEGYGVRNNEPYAPGYVSLDMKEELARRGFSDIKLWDFDPSTGKHGWFEDLPAKRTHYSTVITARKG